MTRLIILRTNVYVVMFVSGCQLVKDRHTIADPIKLLEDKLLLNSISKISK